MEVLHIASTSLASRAVAVDARSSAPQLQCGIALTHATWLLHGLELLLSLIPEMTLIILFRLLEHRLPMTSNRVEVSVQELLRPLVTDALGAGRRAQLLLTKSWCPLAALAEWTTPHRLSSSSLRATKITGLRASTESSQDRRLSSLGTIVPDFLTCLADKSRLGHALLSLLPFLYDLCSPFVFPLQEFLLLGIELPLG